MYGPSRGKNITFLELFPTVIALHIWGPAWPPDVLHFYTDNAAIVDIINRQSSKHHAFWIVIWFLLPLNIFLFRAGHILGVHNTGADYVSRFQVEQFKEISPGAVDLPTLVPTHLLPQSWSFNAKDFVKFHPVLRLPETLSEGMGCF